MVCIYCGSKTQVVNSRPQKTSKQTWRRRKCLNCSVIFSTIERINFSNSLVITNKNDKIEDFVKEKLLLSIYDSLRHRKDSINDSISLTDTVMSRVLINLNTPVIDRNKLIRIVHGVLNRFDKSAAVHYLAYYPIDQIKTN